MINKQQFIEALSLARVATCNLMRQAKRMKGEKNEKRIYYYTPT